MESLITWLIIATIILIRYGLIAGLAFVIFYRFKKQQWSYAKIQQKFPKLNDYQREVGYSMLTLLIFATVGLLVFFSPLKAYTQIYDDFHSYSLAYYFLSIGLMLLLHDTYFYWMHRAIHHPIFYKIVHLTHHKSVNPSPWASYSFHPLEAILEAAIILLIALLIPSHRTAIVLFILISTIYNVYGHLGYEIYPKYFNKKWYGRWLNTSVNHNMHHKYARTNYGLYFTWWDRLMGTTHPDYHQNFQEVTNRVKPSNTKSKKLDRYSISFVDKKR